MLFLVVILLLFVVVFAVQNAQMVDIRFLIWSLSLNQALVVLGSLSIGLVLGAVWSWLKGAGVRGQVKELSRTLDAERRKVENLEKALEEERSRKREYESAQRDTGRDQSSRW